MPSMGSQSQRQQRRRLRGCVCSDDACMSDARQLAVYCLGPRSRRAVCVQSRDAGPLDLKHHGFESMRSMRAPSLGVLVAGWVVQSSGIRIGAEDSFVGCCSCWIDASLPSDPPARSPIPTTKQTGHKTTQHTAIRSADGRAAPGSNRSGPPANRTRRHNSYVCAAQRAGRRRRQQRGLPSRRGRGGAAAAGGAEADSR